MILPRWLCHGLTPSVSPAPVPAVDGAAALALLEEYSAWVEAAVPAVHVSSVTAEFYVTPTATDFASGLGGTWQSREDALLNELAEATEFYGSPLAAAQALFGSHSGKPPRSGSVPP